ncbi:39S ribosomal protein L4, mitochondrial [Habropoda laboriosa]|uniref:Large ribosomal subunit protein uL4m n=1 Tax=Habropoda laboriosa TaxID=597456 RepID=A0A0L7RDY6_9HYME|nr:PREDICTED: 39S ribosomal protein L4, mitochondrial [Habropoda laboriosa]KOC69063.1 39S ribosomal protein L4, mitochondrial [Habropoda laboriosa]
MSILRNLITKLQTCPYQALTFCTKAVTEQNSPIISKIKYADEHFFYQKPREVWLENLDTVERKKIGLVTLHPDVYAVSPRIDIIHQNVRWQRMYKFVSYAHTKTRAEVRGGGRKPWPQKGLGRARHGSIRSPLWRGGGVIHGPRSPTTYFYMLPFYTRVFGLTSALSVKLAQDDLYIIKDMEIPTKESSYIEQLIEERHWGPSLLLVDTDDIMPPNITEATDELKHVNLMPVYGLNVYSMLKHDTLVLTERAARLIEEKILFQLHRPDAVRKIEKFKLNQQ